MAIIDIFLPEIGFFFSGPSNDSNHTTASTERLGMVHPNTRDLSNRGPAP
jgi:hypothetical protein